MVGRLAAKMLAPHFKIALIEASQPQPLEAIPALRVSAINQLSCNLLKQAGLFTKLDPSRLGEVLSIKTLHPRDGADDVLEFSASEIGALQLAYIIENEHLNQVMSEACDEAGITSFSDYCDQATRSEARWTLTLRREAPIQAKLLIVAEGGMSPLRKALKIGLSTRDYGQNAWVAHVESSLPHRNTAYQRFLPEGPLAFLPLANPRYSSIVWTLPTAESLSTEEVCMRLEAAFPDLGSLTLLRGPAAFPLFAQTVDEYVGEGFALIGSVIARCREHNPSFSALIITHHPHLLDTVFVDTVHIMYEGKIIHAGEPIATLELLKKDGYEAFKG